MEEAINFAKTGLNRWNDISGRSRRKEYWFLVLVILTVNIIVGALDGIVGLDGYLAMPIALILLVPIIAAGIRRLHDIGKTGWLMLLCLVPPLCLLLIYFFVQDSQPGDNQYGPNPKGNLLHQ